jgi:hypothetical protein
VYLSTCIDFLYLYDSCGFWKMWSNLLGAISVAIIMCLHEGHRDVFINSMFEESSVDRLVKSELDCI